MEILKEIVGYILLLIILGIALIEPIETIHSWYKKHNKPTSSFSKESERKY